MSNPLTSAAFVRHGDADIGLDKHFRKSSRRLAWQTSADWTTGLAYLALDPQATYRLRVTGYGKINACANGTLLTRARDGKQEIGQFKEFPVPAE